MIPSWLGAALTVAEGAIRVVGLGLDVAARAGTIDGKVLVDRERARAVARIKAAAERLERETYGDIERP